MYRARLEARKWLTPKVIQRLKAMAVEQEVVDLLEAALAVERECFETRKEVHSQRAARGSAQDRTLAATVEHERKVVTEVDGLVARVTVLQDKLELLRSHQKADIEKQRVVLRKADADTEELRGGLTRLDTALAIKQAPGNAEILTPPCAFTMDNFEERKENNEVWYSPPFYTHPMGYKMCLRVYPNGEGNNRGTHVSAYLMILPGEFDDLLLWPFTGHVTIQLLNQRKATRGHISKTLNLTTNDNGCLKARQRVDPLEAAQLRDLLENRAVWGYTQFALHDEVCTPRGYFAATEYLKEDKLIFRVWKVDRFFLQH